MTATTYQVDISAYTHQVIPRFEGVEETITTFESRYPSQQWWGQFAFFHDNSSAGLLVMIADSTPEIQKWSIDATAQTLTITFESGNTPTDIREIAIASADWQDAADVYRAWAMQQSWWARVGSHAGWDNAQAIITGSQTPAAALTAHFVASATTVRHGVIVLATNYKTSAIEENFPDYTLNADYDQAFADIKAIGGIVMPYMQGNLWDKDNVDYDHMDMIWQAPVTITSVTDNGDGTYAFVLAADPERDGRTLVAGDQVVIDSSANASANDEVFTISAVTNNTTFTATHAAGVGAVSDGNCYLVHPFSTTLIDLKTMCHDVAANVSRLVSERTTVILDVNGAETEAVYIDTINSMAPTVCYNPNHTHTAGDATVWREKARELVPQLRTGKIAVVEGWSETCLGLAHGYLSINQNGASNKNAGLIDMINYIYGDIVDSVGWDLRTETDDGTISAAITDGADNFQKHPPCFTYSGTAIPEASIFDGTHSTSQANIQSRTKKPSQYTDKVKVNSNIA